MKDEERKGIIKQVCEIKRNEGFISIIRHSERHDFDGIPVDKWNGVLLTERGHRMAYELGKSLAMIPGMRSVTSISWGLDRCKQTAQDINEGVLDSNGATGELREISSLPSPIRNLEGYLLKIENGKYMEMLNSWLDSPTNVEIFHDYEKWSREVVSSVLRVLQPEKGKAFVIVTHDLHILPIIRTFLERKRLYIDYLDGVVLVKGGRSLGVHYNGLKAYIPLGQLEFTD